MRSGTLIQRVCSPKGPARVSHVYRYAHHDLVDLLPWHWHGAPPLAMSEPTGHALSQTGGHGDFRGRGEDVCACGAALRGIGRVCDGDAEVRKAARDELRRGAHCIKVMASGGVASPTDK